MDHAIHKYDKSKPYKNLRLARYDSVIEALTYQSHPPYSPSTYTESGFKLIFKKVLKIRTRSKHAQFIGISSGQLICLEKVGIALLLQTMPILFRA